MSGYIGHKATTCDCKYDLDGFDVGLETTAQPLTCYSRCMALEFKITIVAAIHLMVLW